MSPFATDMTPEVRLHIDGKDRVLDLDDVDLPNWVKKRALESGDYPYSEKLDKDEYEETLDALHIELVKMQYWQAETGARIVALFEGRDAAGKGGTIRSIRETLNPRAARLVALPKPSDRERTQWYFQRYISHLPAAGEVVLYDRSWYNRAGVEPVMGFCTPDEAKAFLCEAPKFEEALTRDGIYVFKFWLAIGREMQLQRFHDRRHNPRKVWKLSPMDVAALTRWDAYSQHRDIMLTATHTDKNPWTVIRMNDKRRGRINAIRHLLSGLPYTGKDEKIVGTPDANIVTDGPSFARA